MKYNLSIKKKGGIFINKKLFFLIILCMSFLNITNVYAEDTTFYGAEFIDNIYMSKYEYSTGTTYYQKAKMMRNSYNEPVYCIDPFLLFDENASYTRNDNVNNMNPYTIDKIKKIAHFGYGYGNHTDPKWYAATQMMIWREANSNIGRFYFTDTLNGNEITILTDEMNEIEYLINLYNVNPISNDPYVLLENSSMGINIGEAINYYVSNSNNITIRNGTLAIKDLQEGYYEFTLTRYENINNRPGYMYSAPNAQSLLERGDLDNKELTLKVEVYKSRITINKVDKDTNDTIPQGDASLDGAKYGLYKKRNNQLIQEVTIENNQGIIEGVTYGDYYLKEIEPGEGYELDENQYDVKITFTDFYIDLNLQNQVIKKKVIINKQYGEVNNLSPESDIVFDIYNSKNEIIDTVVTNEQGEVEIVLPYGKYKIVQLNSTPGYKSIEPLELNINNNEDETIELIDYKIPVPNTHSEESIIIRLLELLLIVLFF